MNRLWKGRFRWGRLLLVWLVFLLLAGALFAERSGVQYTAAHVQIGALDHALTKEEALAGPRLPAALRQPPGERGRGKRTVGTDPAGYEGPRRGRRPCRHRPGSTSGL